jgi:hypothetical protein
MLVAVIRVDDAGGGGEDAVAAVPLLTFRGVRVTTGLDDAKLLDVEGFGDDVEETVDAIASRYRAAYF